jgi:ribose 5-phosphate isomerase B
MKQFELLTEADARALEIGSSVALARGGHVTPLALDTLKARRVTVVRDLVDPDMASLVPVSNIKRVAIGSDHTGLQFKSTLRDHLRAQGIAVEDVGTHTTEAVDYPDIAAQVARLVSRREADAGIVIDGAGLGSTIAANKVDGIRAAMCNEVLLARYAREHNGANVLAIGATLVTIDAAKDIVQAFLTTPMREPRYLRRLNKIRNLERTR